MTPSWKPVWQHIGVAHVITAGLLYAGVPWPLAALINGVFWFGREFAQAVYRNKSLDPRDWTRRTKHEWIMPSISGVSIAMGAAIQEMIMRLP